MKNNSVRKLDSERSVRNVCFICRYNEKMDKLEPSVTVFHSSDVNILGIIT